MWHILWPPAAKHRWLKTSTSIMSVLHAPLVKTDKIIKNNIYIQKKWLGDLTSLRVACTHFSLAEIPSSPPPPSQSRLLVNYMTSVRWGVHLGAGELGGRYCTCYEWGRRARIPFLMSNRSLLGRSDGSATITPASLQHHFPQRLAGDCNASAW